MTKHRRIVMLMQIAAAGSFLISLPSISGANGEPSADAVNSGIIVPINDTYTHVLDQRIDITLPKPPGKGQRTSAADISVRYELENENKSPVTIAVAWPSGGLSGNLYTQDQPEYPIKISLDGKPLPYKFLRHDTLAEPYVTGWLKQIDNLIKSKPKLKAKVLEVRKIAPKPPKGIDYQTSISSSTQLANHFGQWLVKNGYIKGKDTYRSGQLAAGLLGISYHGGSDNRINGVQSTLIWLNPKHKWVDLNDELAERWGYATLLLNPHTHWLTDLRGPMLYGAQFAVIRFDMTLKPKTKHILNVSYKQQLGWTREPSLWYGMAYFMEPARRWGRWDKTTIVITAPSEWEKVVVRPAPSSGAKTDQKRTLTIAMPNRPHEDLYISLVPK